MAELERLESIRIETEKLRVLEEARIAAELAFADKLRLEQEAANETKRLEEVARIEY